MCFKTPVQTMVYFNFRWLIWICILCGVGKPLMLSTVKGYRFNLLYKIWSIYIIVAIILSYTLTINQTIAFDFKSNLEQISIVNDLIINVFIILVNLVKEENQFKFVYVTIDGIISKLKVRHRILTLISIKMHIWFSMPVVILSILVILEIISVAPPFILLIRAPAFLSMFHLSIHLYLLLATLKIVNIKLKEMLRCNEIKTIATPNKTNTFKYIFNHHIQFIDDDHSDHFDLKILCKIYDDINTYLHSLEDLHGIQILLMIWLMFSTAVVGVTLIACHQTNLQWLVIVRSILPISCCLIGCYIDDHLRKEVGKTESLIIKYLIDYQCDKSRRNTLQTFKQLVTTNRLQFTACNLFDLNYSMILGTIMNIITYSIILIQLFLSD